MTQIAFITAEIGKLSWPRQILRTRIAKNKLKPNRNSQILIHSIMWFERYEQSKLSFKISPLQADESC